jgi:hypothetical protein
MDRHSGGGFKLLHRRGCAERRRLAQLCCDRFGQRRQNENLHGGLRDLQIYNNALSAAQVAAYSNSPEPGTIVLLGGALAGLGLVSRRKRTASGGIRSTVVRMAEQNVGQPESGHG